MPRIEVDPTQETCPSFEDPEWEFLRQNISVLQARPGPKDGVSARHFGADGPIILRTETVPKAFRVLG